MSESDPLTMECPVCRSAPGVHCDCDPDSFADAIRADRDRLSAENASLKEYIAASEEVAKAEDALWYAEEYERLRAGFEKMIKKFEADGGALEFKMTGCEWCGAILPRCDGDSIDLVHLRVKRHIYSCEKHPLKIERDSLSSSLATLKQRCGEVEAERDEAFAKVESLYASIEIGESHKTTVRMVERVARAEHERDAYRSMVCDLLASAHPHPTEHPTMTAQWAKARELLKNGPTTRKPQPR